MLDTTYLTTKASTLGLVGLGVLFTALLWRILYIQKLHPLSGFRGPWYATSSSLVSALISVTHKEPQWLQHLVETYGSK